MGHTRRALLLWLGIVFFFCPSVGLMPAGPAAVCAAEDRPAGPDSSSQTIGQKPEDEEDIRRLFLRQSSVLLASGAIELETGFKYLSNQFSAAIYNARFRQYQLPIALRVGILDRAEAFLSVPLIYGEQTIGFMEDSSSEQASGIADATGGINFNVFAETARRPDMVASLSVKMPTGQEPQEGELTTGAGHWAGSLGLQFIKTADPVVLFWGLRYTYELEARHYFNDGVYDVQPGPTVDYNFGFGFAVNDKISISSQVYGGYQWETRADDREVGGTAAEPVSLRAALTYRFSKKAFIEPSLTIGLNDDAADFIIGLAVSRRFRN